MLGKEIHSFSNDKLNLEKYVKRFIDNYISNDFSGTVFLNGKWGVGKSSYLNLIKSETAKNYPNIKFIDINFWTEQWEEKPFELIAKNLNKFWYFTFKFFPIIFVMVLAGFRFIFDIFTSNTNEISTRDITIWIILILLIALVSFFIKYLSLEDLYLWHLKKYKDKNLVFVCDDFDRIDNDKRMKIYSFISKINNIDSFTLIAIGDYERLINNNDDSLMLQKILTNIENMPSEYNSTYVWEIFEEELEELINIDEISMEDRKLFTEIKKIFIHEERTFRDASQLLELLKRSYTKERTAIVNSSEFLSVCYIYQFYNPVYKWILQNSNFVYEVSSSKEKSSYLTGTNKETDLSPSESINKELEKGDLYVSELLANLIIDIFSQQKEKLNYPSINNGKYLKNYKVENLNLYISLTAEDVEKIFITDSSPVTELERLLDIDQFEDFYELFKVHYLVENSDNELISKYNRLLESLSIILSKYKLKGSGLFSIHPAESLFYKVKRILTDDFDFNREILYNSYVKENNQMDLSQKLFILPKYIAANNENDKVTQINLVNELFEENKNFELLTQVKPEICLYFYTAYYTSFNYNYDHEFRSILELNNEKFLNFIIKNFVATVYSTSGNYEVFYLSNYMFNNEFKDDFYKKVESLPSDSRDVIVKLIENSKDY